MAINVIRRRYQCRICRKTFLEPLHDMNEHHMMTKHLILYIAQQSLRRTFASIANDTGLDEQTVRRVFQEAHKNTEASAIYQILKPAECLTRRPGDNTGKVSLPVVGESLEYHHP